MKQIFATLAVAATLGTILVGAATLANADTRNGPLGASQTVGGDYPDWASDALAPKGRAN
jgi:hypothetical protein